MVRRVLIPIVIAAAAIFAIVRIAVPTLRCNHAAKVTRERNIDASAIVDDYEATLLVRKNLADAAGCIDCEPPNPFLLYELALTQRRLGNHEEAIRTLERALRYDKRPELYIVLGDSVAKTGRIEEGIAFLMTAARFYGEEEGRAQYMMRDIPLIDVVVQRRREELAKQKR